MHLGLGGFLFLSFLYIIDIFMLYVFLLRVWGLLSYQPLITGY